MPPPPGQPALVLSAAMIPPPPVRTLSSAELLARMSAALKSKVMAASAGSKGSAPDRLALFLKNAKEIAAKSKQ